MPPQFAVSIAESSLVLKSKLDEVKPANDQRVIAVKVSSPAEAIDISYVASPS